MRLVGVEVEGDVLDDLIALEAVDYVVNFGDPTPLKLITAIKPDILVKGAEYKKRDIVGAGRDLSERT